MCLSNKSIHRSGFTLVELLVVITIIGILVSLLVPTLAAALKTSREAAIALEIKQLAMAIESFRQERVKRPNFYPPDFTSFDSARVRNNPNVRTKKKAELKGFVRAMARNAPRDYSDLWLDNRYRDNAGNVQQLFRNREPIDLDPAEALVFWLSFSRKNPQAPLLKPDANDLWKFYDFEQDRLDDQDGDGWPEYYPPHGEKTPYVYFSADYMIPDTNNLPPTTATWLDVFDGHQYEQGIACPYFSTRSDPWDAVEGTQGKFQIICAGYDGVFSTYDASHNPRAALSPAVFALQNLRLYPNGTNFTEYDLDNISGFADGRNDNELD